MHGHRCCVLSTRQAVSKPSARITCDVTPVTRVPRSSASSAPHASCCRGACCYHWKQRLTAVYHMLLVVSIVEIKRGQPAPLWFAGLNLHNLRRPTWQPDV